MKRLIPKAILKNLRPRYHASVSWLGSVLAGRPSEAMRVVGVTGTKGKSTTLFLAYHILTSLGKKVGVSSSIYFSDGTGLTKNDLRNSMPGRFTLHNLMKQAKDNGCEIFLVEVTSEGLAQNRHIGIHFDLAAFTNLYPEHLESHGGFEAYKQAKGKLFESLADARVKTIRGQEISKCTVVNHDDEHHPYYQHQGLHDIVSIGIESEADITATITSSDQSSVDFELIKGEHRHSAHLPLVGEFNVINALLALAIGEWAGCEMSAMVETLATTKGVPGRMNVLPGNPTVVVDYAHIPVALEKVYGTVREHVAKPKAKTIAVLGSCGGGRDNWKRGPMGKIAATMNDIVIITDEDPYDEDPQEIIDTVFAGVTQAGKTEGKNAFRVLSRRDAFQKSLELAGPDDVIIITGKGSENSIIRANGRREAWNDTEQITALLNTQE